MTEGSDTVVTFFSSTCGDAEENAAQEPGGGGSGRARGGAGYAYLVVKVWRGSSQHTAVGPEHLSLHLDGQVTQPALLPLAVQIIHDGRSSAGETHVDGERSWGADGRLHGHNLEGKVQRYGGIKSNIISFRGLQM